MIRVVVCLSVVVALYMMEEPPKVYTATSSVGKKGESIKLLTNSTTAGTNEHVWILNLRIQKTGSSTMETFIKRWLEVHRLHQPPPRLSQEFSRRPGTPTRTNQSKTLFDPRNVTECPVLHGVCKTIYTEEISNTWHWDINVKPCSCDLYQDRLIGTPVQQACHAINGPHADYVDLTKWFSSLPDKSSCMKQRRKSLFRRHKNRQQQQQEQLDNQSPNYVVVTVLRDPIERVQSEFRMLQSYARQHKNKLGSLKLRAWDFGCNATTIYEFLDLCPLGASNRQTRFIAGHGSHNRWEDIYHRSRDELLTTAKLHLQQENFVFGISEYWDESIELLNHELLMYPKNSSSVSSLPPSLSKSGALVQWGQRLHLRKAPSGTSNIHAEVREKIETKNGLDIQLYNFAVELFWERYCSAKLNPSHPQCTEN